MSRDAFFHDPQDTLDTRKTPTRACSCLSRSVPPNTQDRGVPAREAPGRGDSIETRHQHSTRVDRSDSRRAYYVRDRAYLLRDSEMHSLEEIGKSRVIATADLTKYAYAGDRARMERDIRALARQSLLIDKTMEISQKKTLRIVTLTKAGHRLVKKNSQLPNDQPIYHGLVEPRELKTRRLSLPPLSDGSHPYRAHR